MFLDNVLPGGCVTRGTLLSCDWSIHALVAAVAFQGNLSDACSGSRTSLYYREGKKGVTRRLSFAHSGLPSRPSVRLVRR
ncbi:hypothetical protein Y032_0155g3084 [Ancylostoma ceylanicum]|uniref:Uncharacterized protein n=1 Tax=Ancylostoma ceylanicum TaxID=53326 RepID=A0A016SZP4_9BILA|nr:hypothetical protein Y032_0155g3084 [Ancylostoma ceylanicum]